MRNSLAAFDVQYSRKKHLMWNLSQLLTQKTVDSPEIILNKKMFPQHAKRSSRTSQTQTRKQKFNDSLRKTKMNFQHYRTKSSLKLRLQSNSLKQEIQTGNCKNQKDLKHQFVQFTTLKARPIGVISLQKSYKSQQIFTNSVLKRQNYAFRQEFYATKQVQFDDIWLEKSLELQKRKSQPVLKKLRQQDTLRNSCKKQFLKKGSSLQKQIVVNLLKNKMLKQHQFQAKRQFNSNDILSMIKVYKGFHKQPSINAESASKYQKYTTKKENSKQNLTQCPLRIVQKIQKPIVGWQIEPIETLSRRSGNDGSFARTLKFSQRAKIIMLSVLLHLEHKLSAVSAMVILFGSLFQFIIVILRN